MTLHIATINGLRMSADHFERATDRDRTINYMVEDLVAAAGPGLDLTSEDDVLRFLAIDMRRWSAKAIRDHADAATDVARQIIVTAGMTRP